MKNEIKVYNFQTEISKESLTDEAKMAEILAKIEGISSIVFDFSTVEGVKEAENVKKQANASIKALKEFCEPFEADGKKISSARSALTTTLVTGKNSVIKKIFAPLEEIKEAMKDMDARFAKSVDDIDVIDKRLGELEELKKRDWLVYKEEALTKINMAVSFNESEKKRVEAIIKAKHEEEERRRIEREEKIRKEAEENAKIEAEKAVKEKQEALERAKIEAENRAALAEKTLKEKKIEIPAEKYVEDKAQEKEHLKKINNEILDALLCLTNEKSAKAIICNIAKGNIPHVSISY